MRTFTSGRMTHDASIFIETNGLWKRSLYKDTVWDGFIESVVDGEDIVFKAKWYVHPDGWVTRKVFSVNLEFLIMEHSLP